MITIFILLILITLSFDMYLMSSVTSFLQKKFVFTDLIRLLLTPTLIAGTILIIGFFAGNYFGKVFKDHNIWYAATLLFALSIKMFYDGLRLNKIKKTINPLDPKGLVLLSFFVGINGFFVGVSIGFLQLNIMLVLKCLLLFVFAIIAGYLTGFRLKKLISFRFEILASLVYFLCAIVIVINL